MKEYELGEICEINSGISLRGKDYVSEGIPVLKIKNIFDDKVNLDDLSFCVHNPKLEIEKYKVRNGDILITAIPPIGKVGINLSFENFTFTQDLIKIRPNREILNSKYLYYFFLGNLRMIKESIVSNSLNRLTPTSIRRIKIFVPSLENQEKIISYLDFFVKLQEELKRDLKNRKIQHRYYRKKIIDQLNPKEG